MKITLDVFWRQYDWDEEGSLYIVSSSDVLRDMYKVDKNHIFIKRVEVEIDDIAAPTRDQVASAKVSALQSERNAIMAETQMKLNLIDDKIKQLSCITYSGD